VLFFGGCFLLSLFVHQGGHITRPMAWAGDQPHYLVQLNSLLLDGDFQLENNYTRTHRGELDGGRFWRGGPLDHHVVWWRGSEMFVWCDFYECAFDRWDHDADGHPVPRLRADAPVEVLKSPGRSFHPVGLVLLVSPFVWPLRHTSLVEQAAIALSALLTLAALLFFWGIISPWSSSRGWVWLTVAAAFLGTPIWHYSQTFYAEPYLLFCAMGAYYYALRRQNGWAAGLFLAAGLLMKPPFLLLAVPLGLMWLWDRQWRPLLLMAATSSIGLVALFTIHTVMFGSPFSAPQVFETQNIFRGVWLVLTNWQHGLLPFAPIAAFAIVGWYFLLRQRHRDAGVFLLGGALYFGLMSLWKYWHGGWSFGPRLILPAIPFIMAGLLPVASAPRWVRGLAIVVLVASVGANFLGATIWCDAMDDNIFLRLAHMLHV
jgi:hypothetical protein